MPPFSAKRLLDSYRRLPQGERRARLVETGIFKSQRRSEGRNNHPETEKARRIS
jgi:hypothetical protein